MITVLYVDDDEGLLGLGRMFLEMIGNFSVETCTSATEALERLQQASYSAVLSDYDMPVMDGIQFLKQVRIQYPGLPFIIFTGRGREDVVVEALNSGADFYLQKGGEPKSQYTELAHKIRVAVERRKSDEQIRHLARLYSVLSKTNEATVYLRNLQGLLTESCRIAVLEGGFLMAWVGLFRKQNGRFEPVAHYSSSNNPSQVAGEPGVDLPVDTVPTSIAIREGRFHISADNRKDPDVAPWRKELLAQGYLSSAAFPLKIGKTVIGAMTFHAGEADFFSEEEVQLLIELTDDLSFALEMMEHEKKKRDAEERLTITQYAIDQVIGGGYLVNSEGRFLFVSQRAAGMLDYSGDELVGMKITDIDRRFIGKSSGTWQDYLLEIRERRVMVSHTEQKSRNGSFLPVRVTAHHIHYPGEDYLWAFLQETGP